MVDYVTEVSDWKIISVVTPINDDIKLARAYALASLAAEVTRGHGNNAIRALVADNIRGAGTPAEDAQTMHKARSSSPAPFRPVPRNAALRHGRQGEESLLWSADTISWALRRHLAIGDREFSNPILEAEKLTAIEAFTGHQLTLPGTPALNTKHPQAAAATPGGQHPRPRQEAMRGALVVSDSKSTAASTSGQAAIGDLYAQAKDIRRAVQQRNREAPATPDHTAPTPDPGRGIGPEL